MMLRVVIFWGVTNFAFLMACMVFRWIWAGILVLLVEIVLVVGAPKMYFVRLFVKLGDDVLGW